MDDKTRKLKFDEIFNSDNLGLLDINEVPKQKRRDEDWRLLEQFQEITQFYEDNKRLPSDDGSDITEFTLASRLSGIKSDPKKVKILLQYDLYNILHSEETKSISLEDILAVDPLGLLTSDAESDSIFNISHVKTSDRLSPDYIARRKICQDFDMYGVAFKLMHEDLERGRRKLVEFKEDDLVEGSFFVLRGVMFCMEVNNSTIQELTYADRLYRRKDGRTRCIFDNGTESTMLFRSLVKAMHIDGFSISNLQINHDVLPNIEPEDVQNGYIYVLRSLSRNPKIRQMRHLYKIGYCCGDVTSRIKNAVNESTYLISDVEVVLTTRCYNLDVPYLESNIHRFFGGCNVLFEIRDSQGINHYPREWFVTPLNIIEDAIRLIVKKEIEHYRYNPDLKMIIKMA